MDGVKRYFVQLFKLGGDEQRYAHGALGAVEIVRASDFDAALAREAALREELAESGRADHLRQRIAFLTTEVHARADERDNALSRLTAAEQRNADTVAKLEMAASMMDDDERGNRFAEVCRLAIKSLNPTESGASE